MIHPRHHGAFGSDTFGQFAEKLARFFGTPGYIIGQTVIVIIWIILNGLVLAGVFRWDPYPFILLNLAFSTQAAYAAPLILLAATRQAERDKASEVASAEHREQLAAQHTELLEANTELTAQIHELVKEIRRRQV